LRTKLFAYNNLMNQWGSKIPKFTNFIFSNPFTESILKKALGIAMERSIPLLSNITLDKYIQNINNQNFNIKYIKTVYLFNDEFTNHLDAQIGIDTIALLDVLNYKVEFVNHFESGRAFLSKGLLKHAKALTNKNVEVFKDLISEQTPLIGIEPSAILTFRDEYPKLADDMEAAKKIAKHTFLVEEFLQREIELGNIKPEQFTKEAKTVKFHGHCHQKALANQASSFAVLNLPENYKVSIISSGCCGMAGSFGYEKEHYEVSMQIGEQTLFPAIRNTTDEVIIVANGTSCRHQIKDGTQKQALHPVSVLKNALI